MEEGIIGARVFLREREVMGGEHGGRGDLCYRERCSLLWKEEGRAADRGASTFRGQEVGVVPVFMKQDMRPSAEKRRRWGEKEGILADREDF